MNNTLKRRIDKISQSMNGGDDGFFSWITICNDGGTIDICSCRSEDCPMLPCSKPSDCWVKQKYPNIKMVYVGLEDEQ